MAKRLEGKKAIVTGSGRGIGKAIAAKLAEEGAAVGLVSRSRDQLESAAREIRDAGGEVSIFPGDVSREDDVSDIIRQFVEQYDSIDFLINNAGIHTAAGPVWEGNPTDWFNDIKVNVFGPYLLCHFALLHMKAGSVIINTASGAGTKPFPYSTAYGASKAALIHFTETLSEECSDREISVFGLRPGAVRTSINKILETEAGKKYLDHITRLSR